MSLADGLRRIRRAMEPNSEERRGSRELTRVKVEDLFCLLEDWQRMDERIRRDYYRDQYQEQRRAEQLAKLGYRRLP